ncbi:MAG: ATP-binding protein [Candidatus Saccharimonadales bacterium]
MQHVKPSWLRIFNYALIGLTAILAAIYILFEQTGASEATKATWGITPSILIIGAIHALYTLIIYPFFYKKYTWATSLLSFVIYAALFAAVIDTSGNTNLTYRLGYAAFVFCMGMNGPFTPLLATLLTWIVLIFSLVGLTTPTKASIGFNILIDIIVTAAAFGGWYVFKRWYVGSGESAELQSLLQQEQLKSNTIIESITDGVMIVDTAGTVQTLNESAAIMLGWSREEATKLDYRSLIVPEAINEKAPEIDAITESLKSGTANKKVSLLTTQHQRHIYVDIVASPLFKTVEDPETLQLSQKHVGTIAILRNVDAQRREEEQRSDFISTASHEMRTPVAAIQGFLELALNPKVATVDDKAREYLQKAYDSTKHLGTLFQDLLTVSKTEDGRLANTPVVIEINELLQELVEQEKMAAAKKQLELHFSRADAGEKNVQPLLYVHADPERLREVILNLIENALKYTKAGLITVGASLKDQSVVIRVSDTGIGMAEEDIPHLFQKFYRIDNSATREIGGTGLGLYISKQVVEQMGGKIWVESKLGEGSTFFVQIPRVSAETVQAAQPAPRLPD